MSSAQNKRRLGWEVVLFCGGRDCTEASHGQLIRTDIFGLMLSSQSKVDGVPVCGRRSAHNG